MTNTAKSASASSAPAEAQRPLLSRTSGSSLIEQIVQLISSRIDDKILRTGARMPSIRQFSDQHQVSRFTVVEAYDRLVAGGLLESRRGSGFYVRDRSPMLTPRAQGTLTATPQPVDVVWLVRNMFRQLPPQKMPGVGLLPNEWLDGDLVANALRAVSRQNPSLLLQYGIPQGFLPLRQQLQLKMAELEIAATPDQFVTTAGVTQALDLVARHYIQPGDTIFVDDPGWFLMFGSFAALGAKAVSYTHLRAHET